MAKILIAEDEAIVALDLRTQLQALGHSIVAVVNSGRAAVEQATRTHPDLIMMDVRLRGEMDGVEAARAIAVRLEIPVIFVSALIDKETMDRARAVKHGAYIVKPFSEDKLLNAIEAALTEDTVFEPRECGAGE
jgi:CheY-like chemotaxis protein